MSDRSKPIAVTSGNSKSSLQGGPSVGRHRGRDRGKRCRHLEAADQSRFRGFRNLERRPLRNLNDARPLGSLAASCLGVAEGRPSAPTMSITAAALPRVSARSRQRRRPGAVSASATKTGGGADADEKSKGAPMETVPVTAHSRKVTPGSRPPLGAEKQDEAAVRYATEGDWKKALQLIKAMRDGNFVPSVTAYVATIEACRRELLFDYASALLRDMFRVCLPDDLFLEYAASHPNEKGVSQTQRVFSLLLMMREDQVSPLEETYRAIMGLCSKERLWHLSLLLLEHLRQSGLEPGKFVWDEICTVLFKTGHAEMATMMFEDALEAKTSGGDNLGVVDGLLDLHNYTASTALAAVRIALLDMVRKPTTRGFHDPSRSLHVVTGMGNNSKDGEAVIKPQVMELLTAMGLEPKLMPNNEGCVVLQSQALKAYISRLPSGGKRETAGDAKASQEDN